MDTTRQVERALDELRRGYAVHLTDGAKGLWVTAAEHVGIPQRGPFTMVLSAQRAHYLKLGRDAVAINITAGDEALLNSLLYAPRMEGTLSCTPAAPLEQVAVTLVKQAGFLPAALVVPPCTDALEVSVQALQEYLSRPIGLELDNIVRLPIAASEDTRIAVFLEHGGCTHLALLIGKPEGTEAPLVRLHSACFTGDLLGSLRCDCGDQLHDAIDAMAKAGSGVLLYLNQEGRGIGLINKLRAYRLQEKGLDTVDANLALGFAEEERDFAVAAEMLRQLRIPAIRLLTNNPLKVDALTQEGITVRERVPLHTEPGEHNKHYLETKANRMGHRH